MEERRTIERRPYSNSIEYSLTVLDFKDRRRVNQSGEVVDVSDVGLGIKTDFPLEPGHVLTFHDGVEVRAGIVEWSSVAQNNGCRAGIRFV